MRSILYALVLSILISSCTKEATVPATTTKDNSFFRTANISIIDAKASQTSNRQIVFHFTTEYEKNLKSIELLSGPSQSLFCRIFKEDKFENSLTTRKYSIADNEVKGATMFYLIKYTTNGGDVAFSPVFQVNLQ